jgi:hypothetical protein
MIELLLLIAGIVLLWKGSGALSSLMFSAEEKSNNFAEGVVAECALDRAKRVAKFREDSKNLEIVPHTDAMEIFQGNKK